MINEAFDGVESFRADNLINTFKLIIDFFLSRIYLSIPNNSTSHHFYLLKLCNFLILRKKS